LVRLIQAQQRKRISLLFSWGLDWRGLIGEGRVAQPRVLLRCW